MRKPAEIVLNICIYAVGLMFLRFESHIKKRKWVAFIDILQSNKPRTWLVKVVKGRQ